MEALTDIVARVGSLSEPSKMPCRGYSLPADQCKVGSLLRKIKGSTCSGCYAMRGNYRFPDPQRAMKFRLRAIKRPGWVADMTELISRKEKSGYFRWHDSGDLQSPEHLLI